MNKLTNIESQRVMAVLGETLDRLNYLSYIPKRKDLHLVDLLNENRCQVVSTELDKLWHLEEVYDVLSAEKNIQSEEALKRVRGHARHICRELRTFPAAVTTLQTLKNDRSPDGVKQLKTLSQLADITYRRLLATVEDDANTSKIMSGVSQRKKLAEEETTLLRASLLEIRTERDVEVAQLETQLSKLSIEIEDIRKSSKYELGIIDQDMQKLLTTSHDAHSIGITALFELTTVLENTMAKMNVDHCVSETILRKKKCKLSSEVTTIVEKYDVEMNERHCEIEELQNHFDQEQSKYNELREHFAKADDELERIAEEESVVAAIRSRRLEAENAIHDAAIVIQKIYRGFMARRYLLKDLVGKKSKKKGKKK